MYHSTTYAVLVGIVWTIPIGACIVGSAVSDLQAQASSEPCSCSSLYVTKRSDSSTTLEDKSVLYDCQACKPWQEVPNHPGEYMVPGGTHSFQLSRKVCQTCGGDVIVVENGTNLEVTFEAIMEFLGVNERYLWVGIIANAEQRVLFEWLDGRRFPSNDSAWAPNQPNDSPGPQDCVATSRRDSWRMHDKRCWENYNIICQKPGFDV